jgi:thiamine transport system substrate-binding protein
MNRSRPWWTGLSALLLSALMLIAGACGDDAADSADETSDPTDLGSEVVLVTYSAYALPDEAAAAFTEETGVEIKVVHGDDAGSALSQAILTAGAPEGDVFFGIDNTFLTRGQESEAFDPYSPDALDQVPDEFQLDESGRFVPIDESTVCVLYDQSWFESNGLTPPTDLESLADPAYKGLLVVENPALSSPGLAFLTATHAEFGDETDAYWERLRQNDVSVAASWDDAWYTGYTTSGGDRPIVVSYASSPPAEVIFSEGALTEPDSAVVESTCVRQVEFAGLLAGAANPAAGKALIDAMLGELWQEALPMSNFVFPVRGGTELPIEFDQWAVQPADPIVVSAAEIGEQRETWIDEWRTVME